MKVYTPRQLAESRGVCLKTVRNWIRGVRGVRLEYGVRDGRTMQISERQVEKFLAELAAARRQRPREVPGQYARQRPRTAAQRRKTRATLRACGFDI
jgi:hypothetical protein